MCSLLSVFILIVITVALFIYWYQTKNFNYWRDRKVPFLQPHWIFGNIKDPLLKKISWAEFATECYKQFKDRGFGGVYLLRKPAVIICSPDLIEKVLVDDFSYFQERTSFWNSHEILSKALVYAKGDEWRVMRYYLSSAFTTDKLKCMSQQIFSCSNNFLRNIKAKKLFEVESLVFEFTTEVIASCTLGVQLLSGSSENGKFWSAVDVIFNSSLLHMPKILYAIVHPKIFNWIRNIIMPNSCTKFFVNFTQALIRCREHNGIEGTDILQLLLTLKEKEKTRLLTDFNSGGIEENEDLPKCTTCSKLHCAEKLFSDDYITAQIFNILFGGTIPTVTPLSFALLEIARNDSIQRRIQEEVDSIIIKYGGWNYSAFQEMVYIDQVIQETMRVYNYRTFLLRSVTKPYKIPGTDIVLEKGVFVNIPVSAIHMDPQYYPDPEVFDPDRFAGNNYRPSAVFLPFGAGPRTCIAMRFAVLIIKMCISRTLLRYSLKVNEKTPSPLTFDNTVTSPKVKGGLWLEAVERENICNPKSI
uniref:Cytochrome P450 n=1 Tax=Graphocephala atropunctata TaxID=36148 RepID=A0A1B6KQ36_9HEMI